MVVDPSLIIKITYCVAVDLPKLLRECVKIHALLVNLWKLIPQFRHFKNDFCTAQLSKEFLVNFSLPIYDGM